MLVDRHHKVAKAYHADAILIVRRTVYRIDKKGRIAFAQRGMPDPAEALGTKRL